MKQGSMVPDSVRASGNAYVRMNFAGGQRLFALLTAGLLFVPLIFLSSALIWALIAWNFLVACVFAIDLRNLPAPEQLAAERCFEGVLHQLETTQVCLSIENRSLRSIHCEIVDSVPPGLANLSVTEAVSVPAGKIVRLSYEVAPERRGEHQYSKVFARYEGPLRIAQRWASFELDQVVRVYPTLRSSRQQEAIFLRSRQIDLQNRVIRQRGHGREFESLREFQVGDESRDICWTATARRSNLVTTLRQSERSQTVWAVVDCGRLMRARHDGRTKLDYATETAMRLAQLANYSSDSSALLAYGDRIQQRRLPGKGNQHLHAMLDQLALLKEESSEADHLHAAGALLSLQKRRAMVMWITDLADLAITPEVVTGALHANKRHFVVVAVIGQPDVARLVAIAPRDEGETYLYAAASETMRRRELTIAMLRSRGVHVIEVPAPQLTGAVLNKYLEAKQKNLL